MPTTKVRAFACRLLRLNGTCGASLIQGKFLRAIREEIQYFFFFDSQDKYEPRNGNAGCLIYPVGGGGKTTRKVRHGFVPE